MSDPFHLATDQAARITELTDRITQLEAALRNCVEYIEQDSEYPAEIIDPARAALGDKP